jgi:hypothetical protein
MQNILTDTATDYKLMRELFELLKYAEQKELDEAKKKARAFFDKLEQGKTFQILLTFNSKRENGTFVEKFYIEGYRNTKMILEAYRKIGFDIDLKNINVCLPEDNYTKVAGITFVKR